MNQSENFYMNFLKYFKDEPQEIKPDKRPNLKEIEEMERKSDINNINSIIGVWIKDQEQNTKMRERYAYIIFALLALQIIVVNVMMFLLGYGKIKLENMFFYWFLTLVVGEIIGFVFVVAKYLFKHNDRTLEQIIKLLKSSKAEN